MIIIWLFLHNNHVSMSFLHTSVTKKNKIFFKEYENFSQKTDFICLTNLEWQRRSMMVKLNLFRIYIFYPGRLESCHSLAKNNFVRVTFWKFGVVCGRVVKKAEACRNCYIIILKWRSSREHCMYNENW